jgi:hypothetical protein
VLLSSLVSYSCWIHLKHFLLLSAPNMTCVGRAWACGVRVGWCMSGCAGVFVLQVHSGKCTGLLQVPMCVTAPFRRVPCSRSPPPLVQHLHPRAGLSCRPRTCRGLCACRPPPPPPPHRPSCAAACGPCPPTAGMLPPLAGPP